MIGKALKYKLYILLIILSSSIYGQIDYGSEEELKAAAAKLFDEKKFNEAKPLFAQLLSNYPKDPNYSYKYAACLLVTEKDKEEPIKYLSIATRTSTVEPLAYYYLGKAYHLNYQFNEAITNYSKFQSKATSDEIKEYKPARQIEMCRNGISLLDQIKDISVLSKQEIKESDFFRVYDLKGIGGKVVVKPDEFKSKYDLKIGERSLIYIPKNPEIIYYSSYGDKGNNGKDIYYVRKLPNGEWGKPQDLGGPINSEFDEEYPFLQPDGKTLYFSSNGHNSMGGYDVFKSTYNETSGTWSKPINLDFAFSSPDDDIMFISDEDNIYAYFASKRSSGYNQISVYKVKVASRPASYSIIKGDFIVENSEKKSATIKVLDANTNEFLSEYTTKENGEYIIALPSNGGKYKFVIETDDESPVHSGMIEVPVLSEFRPLKQELRLVGAGDDEKLVIKNLFDEQIASNIDKSELMKDLIKQKAQLEVTGDDSTLANNTKENIKPKISDYEYTKLTDDDLINNAKQQASELQQNSNSTQKERDYSLVLAKEKSTEASKLFAESEKLLASINSNMSEQEKLSIEQKALDKKKEAGQLAAEAVIANNIARSLEAEYIEKQTLANKANVLSEKVAASINASNRDSAIVAYKDLQTLIDNNREMQDASSIEKQLAYERAESDKKKTQESYEYLAQLQESKSSVINRRKGLEQAKEAEKNKKKQEQIQNEINALNIDLEDIEFNIAQAQEKSDELKKKSRISESVNKYTNVLFQDIAQNASKSNTKLSDSEKENLLRQLDYYELNNLVGEFDETLASEFKLENVDYGLNSYNTKHQNELDKTKLITDPVELAYAKKEINQEWLNDIKAEKENKLDELIEATSLQEKADIQKRINELNQQQKEKEYEIAQNEKIIEENQLANNSNNNSTENSNTNTSNQNTNNTTETNNNSTNTNNQNINETNNSSIEISESTKETADFIATTNKKYTDKINRLGNSELDNEQKELIYEAWQEELQEKVLLKKLELIETTDTKNEEALNTQISLLNAEYENVTKEAEQFALNADNNTTESNSNLTNNSSANNSTSQENKLDEVASFNAINNNEVTNYNNDYNELSTEIESTTNDEYEKNLKLAKLNENWANSIQEEIAYREENLENIKKSKDKKLEEEKIAQLKEMKSQKENESYTYAENAEEILADKNTTLASNNTTNTNNNPQKNTQEFIENPTYSNPSAEKNAAKANQLENEAEKANSEYQELVNQSYNAASEEEREELTTKAESLRIQSENKLEAAAKISAIAHQAEYNRNSTVIKSMQKNIEVNNTQTTIAELKNGEAAVYFNDAKKLREEAENTSSFSSKQNLLNQAKEKELIAIQRQNEAKEIYSREGGPQIAAIDNMSNQELLAANNFSVGNQANNNNTTSQNNNTTLATNQNNNTTNTNNTSNNNTSSNQGNNQTNNTNLATNNNTNNTSSSNQNSNNTSNNNSSNNTTNNNSSENNNTENTTNNLVENNSTNNQNNTNTSNNSNNTTTSNTNSTSSNSTQINPNNYESIESLLAKVDNDQSVDYTSPGDVKKYEADILQKEAENLNNQATALRKQAEETRKKKEKEALILEAESIEEKAARKAKEAEVLYEEAEQLPAITSKNDPEIIASTKSNEELNEQEKSTLANLTDNEVSKILETEEYKAYQSSVERKRKLIKEAEVEYAYSEQYLTEAKNQQAIKEELQKLVESDNISEEQKAEVSEQIKTIDKRIALLNEQSNQYKLSADSKTEKAKQSDTFINSILARLDENTKNNLVAIEKENYNTNGNIAASALVGSNSTLANNQENNSTENNTSNTSNNQTNNQNNATNSSNNNSTTNNQNSNNTTNNNSSNNTTTNNNSSVSNSNNNSNLSLGIGTVNLNNIAELTMPKQINKDIIVFGNNNQSAYNEQKKIPNNTPYPDGLIYAVQVGAFRNPIPQDLYKGFAPVFGTKLDNGITRYTAGLFTSYSSADDSKNKIRALGYSDAFVVIFYNGERISQAKANEILNGGKQIASNNQNTTANNNSQNSNTTNNTTNIDNLPTINPNSSDGAVNVNEIKGIFFTVQVGVYSKPVTPNDLNNIRPLNSETTPNGLIRYTSGRYKTLAEANAAKDRIRGLGISDAFVTAYKNGNKISVNEALAELQNSTSNTTNNSNENYSENNTENTNNNSTENNNTTENTNNNSTENNTSNNNNTETNTNENKKLGELEFKVLIGKYTDEVPVDVAAIYLKIAKRGLKSTQEGDTTIYTIGSFKEYKDALKTKIEMKSMGITDADVIVYEDGVRKPIEPILKKLGQ